MQLFKVTSVKRHALLLYVLKNQLLKMLHLALIPEATHIGSALDLHNVRQSMLSMLIYSKVSRHGHFPKESAASGRSKLVLQGSS